MTRLFGTDGVRGVANVDLTPDLAVTLGRAASRVLAPDGGALVVGRDTRISGPMLEAALIAGLCSAGCDVLRAGILPTPAVAFLTRDFKAIGGAVVSASHNPVDDNGIKFFDGDATKTTSDIEDRIEAAMTDTAGLPSGTAVGAVEELHDAADRYVDHLLTAIDDPLTGLRIVLDCAYGAAWNVGPRAFREAGAEVIAINAEADGTRINVACGSTDLTGLSRAVVSSQADLGLAFDGDADRALAVDETGSPVDGDHLLAMTAKDMHAGGNLDKGVVVATVMANLGFVRTLEADGITVAIAPVGDKYVAQAMAEHGAVLGGEQSGHIIFGADATTGDGILTGLKVAEQLRRSNSSFSEIVRVFEPFPQVLINVPAARSDLDGSEELWADVRAAEAELGDNGRVLLRASGTEPLVRVMVEASDADVARDTAEQLARSVEKYLAL